MISRILGIYYVRNVAVAIAAPTRPPGSTGPQVQRELVQASLQAAESEPGEPLHGRSDANGESPTAEEHAPFVARAPIWNLLIGICQ